MINKNAPPIYSLPVQILEMNCYLLFRVFGWLMVPDLDEWLVSVNIASGDQQ